MTASSARTIDKGAPPEELHPVTYYLPFVRRVAQRVARRLPTHVALDDLLSAGVVGLLEAMDRYDSDRVTDFETYAEFRVKGAILDELRRRDLMARDARLKAKNIEKVVVVLRQELGHEPEEEQIAKRLGCSIEDLRVKLQKLMPVRVVSLTDLQFGKGVVDSVTPFDKVARKELLERLQSAIERLNERHQQVLQLYYKEDLTLREIGEVLGVTESRVCQIVSEATIRLRALLGDAHGKKISRNKPRRKHYG